MDELESQKGALLTETSQVEGNRLSLNLNRVQGFNAAEFYEEQEDEDYNFFLNQDTQRTFFRKNSDPESFIFNYKGKVSEALNVDDFKIEKVEEKFPDLPEYVKNAQEAVKSSLSTMSQNVDYENVYRLTYKDNKRICWFQGNKKSIKGSGYCRIMSKMGEYFEGLVKNFQLLKGLICLENEEFYFGAYFNNACNGVIEQFCPNGDKFKGVMKEGIRHGKGKIEWSDGSSYDGNFKFDGIHGNGVYKYKSGDIYNGHFVEGVKEGKGKKIS